MTRLDTLIIGSGAAGLAAAVRLDALGQDEVEDAADELEREPIGQHGLRR